MSVQLKILSFQLYNKQAKGFEHQTNPVRNFILILISIIRNNCRRECFSVGMKLSTTVKAKWCISVARTA